VLESLGWRICRVWSTDWLRDRAGQVQRVQAALAEAQQDGPGPAPVPPSVEPTGEPAAAKPPKLNPVPPPARSLNYESIEDVPEQVLQDVVLGVLRTFGATQTDDLIQAASHHLGFKRTGKRIQARMEEALEELARAGRISRTADQRFQAAQAPRAVER
jgi:hypothetical protein